MKEMKYTKMLTRDEAKAIVEKSEAFYVVETAVEGYKVEMYNYRLATYDDFKDNDAWEMRGLTFVYNPEFDKWERHIALNKFFNVNQVPDWQYDDLKDKTVVNVQDKLDGSLISFVRFPNGVWRAKSKMSFISEQAKMAQNIFDKNRNVRDLVEVLDGGYCFFELTSPFNQIVVSYEETLLSLLQVRADSDDHACGYVTREYVERMAGMFNVPVAPYCETKTLDELLEEKATNKEDIEGWIVTFHDGQMAKVKTDAYMDKHGTISEIRENDIIRLVLDEEVDDVLSVLTPGTPKYDQVEEITTIVTHKFNHMVAECMLLVEKYKAVYNLSPKEFALNERGHPLFNLVVNAHQTDENDIETMVEKNVKNKFLKETSHLRAAQEWLK